VDPNKEIEEQYAAVSAAHAAAIAALVEGAPMSAAYAAAAQTLKVCLQSPFFWHLLAFKAFFV
jgi:Xaa-Pro aminopeptidase